MRKSVKTLACISKIALRYKLFLVVKMPYVHVDGVYGDYRHNAVLISHHNICPNAKIWFDDITIERVRSHKSAGPLPEGCFRYWDGNIKYHPIVWIEAGVEAGQIILRDISRVETSDTCAPLIKIDETAKIDRLIMDNIWQKADEGIEFIMNNGDIKTLIKRDVEE